MIYQHFMFWFLIKVIKTTIRDIVGCFILKTYERIHTIGSNIMAMGKELDAADNAKAAALAAAQVCVVVGDIFPYASTCTRAHT